MDSISVMDFGAVGDGVADDTAAIQSAFNSLVTSGYPGVVTFPGRTFRITSQLDVDVSYCSIWIRSAKIDAREVSAAAIKL